MNWDDFYEPSEFDMMIEEWKEKLRQSVKKEYQDEMERLKKQNVELANIKDKWKEKCQEIEAEKARLKQAELDAENKAKSTKLHDLLESCMKPAWGVSWEKVYVRDKCDKCDEEGYIHYRSPSGRKEKERCLCRESRVVYKPIEAEIAIISKKLGYNEEVDLYYRYDRGRDCDEDKFVYVDKIYSGQDFEDIGWYNEVIFLDLTDCQKFCEYLNDKETKRIEEKRISRYDRYKIGN